MMTDDSSAFIDLKNVKKAYSKHEVLAVNSVNLKIDQGETVAFMGESGCGKSTLFNLIGGIDRPDRGRIRVASHDLIALNDSQLTQFRQENIGFVFQFFNLLSTLTVAENVALPLELMGKDSPKEIEAKVKMRLEQVDMVDRAEFYPAELSGGQMQRTAIARALIHDPAIILADEPTGNLDSANGERVMSLLLQCCQDNGQTLLIATHSTEAAKFAHRTVAMKDGKILEPMTLANMMSANAHEL